MLSPSVKWRLSLSSLPVGLKTMMAVLLTFTERPHSAQYDCRTFNMAWRLSLSRAKSTRSSAQSRCVTLKVPRRGTLIPFIALMSFESL